jgi:hypothetical protein
MPKFKLRGPDGGTYAISADTPEAAHAALYGTQQTDPPKIDESPEVKTDKLSGPERWAKAGIHGLISGVENVANLAEKSGAKPSSLQTLKDLASGTRHIFGVTPQEYKPAGEIAGNENAPVMDRLSNAPRALLEGAAPVAVGGMLGGPVGAAMVGGATQAAPIIDKRRQALGLTDNQELSAADKMRVGADLAANMLLSGVGAKYTFGAAPVRGVGLQGIKQAAGNVLKAGAVDAGIGATQTAADKELLEGTNPSLSDLAVGAYGGAVTGGAGALPKALHEAKVATRYKKLSDLNSEGSVNRIANGMKSVIDNTPEGSTLDPFTRYQGQLKVDQDNAFSSLGKVIKDNKTLNGTDTISPIVKSVREKLNAGEKISPTDLNNLSQNLSGYLEGDRFLQLLKDQSVFNEVAGKFKDKELSKSTAGKQLNPLEKTTGLSPAKAADLSLIWGLIHNSVKPIEYGIAGVQAAGTLGLKALDRFTGRSDPAQVIMNKFGGEPSVNPLSNSSPYVSSVDALRKELENKRIYDKVVAKTNLAFSKKIDAIKDPFYSKRERQGVDKGIDVNMPPNPGYGTSSPIDVKSINFLAQLASNYKNKTGKQLNVKNLPPALDENAPLTPDLLKKERVMMRSELLGNQENRTANQTSSDILRKALDLEIQLRNQGVTEFELPIKLREALQAEGINPQDTGLDLTSPIDLKNGVKNQEKLPALSIKLSKTPMSEALAADTPSYTSKKQAISTRPDLDPGGWYKVNLGNKRYAWQHESDITHSKKQRVSGTKNGNAKRDTILETGLELNLSEEGKKIYRDNLYSWKAEFSKNDVKYSDTAKARLQKSILSKFKGNDVGKVRRFLLDGVYVKDGNSIKSPKFLSVYRHKNKEAYDTYKNGLKNND